MTEAAVYRAARKYIGIGFSVFPIVPGTKKPYRGSGGFKDAIADIDLIPDVFKEDSDIASPNGGDRIVLDVDQHGEDGHQTLRDLERQHGPLPLTASVKTPRDGQQFYLRGDAPTTVIGSGVEIRGRGSYVVLPPSSFQGRAYVWDNHVLEVPIAPAPQWLLDLANANKPNGGPVSREKLREIALGVEEGQNGGRNVAAVRIIGHLLNRNVDIDVVIPLMIGWDQLNKPPLGEQTILRRVESIAKKEARKWTA